MTKSQPRVRPGDAVRIKTNRHVLRVGYPKSVDDYVAEVEAMVGGVVDAAIVALVEGVRPSRRVAGTVLDLIGAPWYATRARKRVLRDLAWARAHADGFGGRERAIHWGHDDRLVGADAWVESARTVVTGTYEPARRPSVYGGHGAWGNDEGEPAALLDQARHRVLEVHTGILVADLSCITVLAADVEVVGRVGDPDPDRPEDMR